ncbi:hypothetical protein V1289_007374 [Bradyrhizobium sp. AZCC 2289]
MDPNGGAIDHLDVAVVRDGDGVQAKRPYGEALPFAKRDIAIGSPSTSHIFRLSLIPQRNWFALLKSQERLLLDETQFLSVLGDELPSVGTFKEGDGGARRQMLHDGAASCGGCVDIYR